MSFSLRQPFRSGRLTTGKAGFDLGSSALEEDVLPREKRGFTPGLALYGSSSYHCAKEGFLPWSVALEDYVLFLGQRSGPLIKAFIATVTKPDSCQRSFGWQPSSPWDNRTC